jgi:hypothetical protein
MRYLPLLIALFLTMLLKPIADHFGSFNVPDSVLLLIVFLTAIYAFRHVRRLAACLVVLAAISLTLRFAAHHGGLSVLEIGSQGSNFIAMVLIMIAILYEVLRARSASSDLVMGAVSLDLYQSRIVTAWELRHHPEPTDGLTNPLPE